MTSPVAVLGVLHAILPGGSISRILALSSARSVSLLVTRSSACSSVTKSIGSHVLLSRLVALIIDAMSCCPVSVVEASHDPPIAPCSLLADAEACECVPRILQLAAVLARDAV